MHRHDILIAISLEEIAQTDHWSAWPEIKLPKHKKYLVAGTRADPLRLFLQRSPIPSVGWIQRKGMRGRGWEGKGAMDGKGRERGRKEE